VMRVREEEERTRLGDGWGPELGWELSSLRFGGASWMLGGSRGRLAVMRLERIPAPGMASWFVGGGACIWPWVYTWSFLGGLSDCPGVWDCSFLGN
jgi:hypothetical protein